MVDAVVIAGGELSLPELCELLHKKRPRDVRRKVLPMLEEVGIIEVAGDLIRVAPDWREALESERREKGEIEADELAEDRRKRKSRAYRERDKVLVSKPSPAGLAAVGQSREKRAANITAHEEHQAKARAADLEHRRAGAARPRHRSAARRARITGDRQRGAGEGRGPRPWPWPWPSDEHTAPVAVVVA